MNVQKLTEKQRLILDAIVIYWRTNTCAPAVRDLCAIFGIRSTNGIDAHLRALEKKGFIRRYHPKRAGTKTRSRSIVIDGMEVTFPEWVKELAGA